MFPALFLLGNKLDLVQIHNKNIILFSTTKICIKEKAKISSSIK